LQNAQGDVYGVGQVTYTENNFWALSPVSELSRLRPQEVHKDFDVLSPTLSTAFCG